MRTKPYHTEFGEMLYDFRLKRGISQGQLARTAGLVHSHISRLESGQRLPTLKTVERICDALGFPKGDERRKGLLAARGFSDGQGETPLGCMELYLINDLYLRCDERTQMEIRMMLRGLAESIEFRLESVSGT